MVIEHFAKESAEEDQQTQLAPRTAHTKMAPKRHHKRCHHRVNEQPGMANKPGAVQQFIGHNGAKDSDRNGADRLRQHPEDQKTNRQKDRRRY